MTSPSSTDRIIGEMQARDRAGTPRAAGAAESAAG